MLNYLLLFIVLILIVVFIHEYGHYYFAKKYGVGITDFSIGCGQEIFGWNDKSGTRWKICWIPLGGYVKFFGDRNVFSQADQEKIIEKYKQIAHRDAQIVSDTIVDFDENTINVLFRIEEGNQYFIRNIEWSGNQKYSTGLLDTILGIKKGDLYDQATLDTKLFMNPNGNDISSLYMDDGYLFFQVTPVEKKI